MERNQWWVQPHTHTPALCRGTPVAEPCPCVLLVLFQNFVTIQLPELVRSGAGFCLEVKSACRLFEPCSPSSRGQTFVCILCVVALEHARHFVARATCCWWLIALVCLCALRACGGGGLGGRRRVLRIACGTFRRWRAFRSGLVRVPWRAHIVPRLNCHLP